MSIRSNLSYTTLLASARERAAGLTGQTMSLRGRAAVGAVGAAAIGVMTLGSAAGALAASGPAETGTTAAVAGQVVGAGKAGNGAAMDSAQVAEKGGAKAANAKNEAAGKQEFAGKKANSAESSTVKTASVKDVVKLAEKQIGIHEGKDGNTKFNRWYVKSDHAKRTAERDGGSVKSYNGVSWCDMFVSWIGEKANVKGIGADAYTPEHAQWFKDHDHWGKKPRPGAVVFYSWDGGKSIGSIEHVGFVVKDNHDGTITTIEGNTSNSVDKKVRPTSEVVGYGYPQYSK